MVRVEDVPSLPGSQIFIPSGAPLGGVVLLHGSEGGRYRSMTPDAMLLAEAGYVSLVYCYFDCEGMPDSSLDRVPLDRTLSAVQLVQQQHAAGKKVALYGISRGAEQTLLIASLVQRTEPLAAVAVHAASDTVVCAYDSSTRDGAVTERDPQTGETINAPAWTWQGQALYGERDPYGGYGTGPRIEVEKYTGPMFLSHDENDQLWEVQRTRRVEQSRQAVPQYPTEVHYWPGEDHILAMEANIRAYNQALIAYFDKHLR
jgi:dipeptidyl aminopeptidase/acylaminoacyl peptidase